jgi:hypothetical protein
MSDIILILRKICDKLQYFTVENVINSIELYLRIADEVYALVWMLGDGV